MKSFISTSTALLSLLASTVHAQYEIDPNSVSTSTRDYWCSQQQSECPLICLQTTSVNSQPESNTCDADSLTYACVCSNGLSPNISEYSQTLPFYICQEWGNQCVSNCGADASCASDCRQNHPCGALDPTRVNVTSTAGATGSGSTTATSAAGSGTPTAAQVTNSQGTVYSGFAGAAPTGTTTQSSAAGRAVHVWALGVGQTFGTLGLAGALFGGMAILL